MNQSIGIIEVIGLTAATACIDGMVKAAFVEVYNIKQTGSGMLTIIIQGDLASVQFAVEKGADVAQSFGELIGIHVIPRPYSGLEKIIGEKKVICNESC
ncbi:BMC domain-containing protein [Calidifontibacillus erzurumensis]|uniref:BMC domain-containing protein n=1 Tax=Calidifontibacillus erzurumensis TaxID=2741433 RepID=UPI0035B5665F